MVWHHRDLLYKVRKVKFVKGGYPKFISQGLNDNYLPVWLQNEGYNTFYTGKLFVSQFIRRNYPYLE